MSGHEDADEAQRRKHGNGTSQRRGQHIPTIKGFREEKRARQADTVSHNKAEDGAQSIDEARDYAQKYLNRDAGKDGEDDEEAEEEGDEVGEDAGATEEQALKRTGRAEEQLDASDGEGSEEEDKQDPVAKDTSETDASYLDPRQKRKAMKKRKDERAEREVTDPVTHLPVRIHDFTSQALKDAPENDPAFGTTLRTATGLSNKNKSAGQLHKETEGMLRGQEELVNLFPPPSFDAVRAELLAVNQLGITVGLLGAAIILGLTLVLERVCRLESLHIFSQKKSSSWFWDASLWLILASVAVGGIALLIVGVRQWTSKRIDTAWQDSLWEAHREEGKSQAKHHETETTIWLNSLMSAVWPMVNPDLFTSLADTLEDVMQASLPKLVRMVSVDDVGQGSEALKILGVRWLPTGAAARSVGADGKLKKDKDSKSNDRTVPGQGEVDPGDGKDDNSDKNDSKDNVQDAQQGAEIEEGMEAEEGNFVNLEVAFSYRGRSDKSGFNARTKDMHLYLAFYLPGNIKLPVWVDLRGIVGIMRMRLQLTPDPPFFALCTLTFLGQPKVDLSCQPLSKHGLNIMDVPLISNFVQSAVDAAMAEYVAPKSLTLDLKDMLAGDDFKKDTVARGVLVVTIVRGYDFKIGDVGIPMIKDGSADPYVSVGWAKFGKPMWSARIMQNEMAPVWNETTYLLVTPDELNVDERLRVQLWDSDRFTADDDLGRIEVDLKQLMKDEATNGKISTRTDGFRALQAGDHLPGKLEWRVGYFSKARIQQCQLEKQTFDPDTRTSEALDKKVGEISERKLRETEAKSRGKKQNADELRQERAQELKMRQDAMMISAPPPDDYPSGVFAIQIHQIVGLELEQANAADAGNNASTKEDEAETGEELPSAYCMVMLNHAKIFRTRTKPKNAKPFFNAGIERFVPDWQSAEVHISIRDARVHEDDALLGVIHLPLADVFKHRAQVNGFYPISGGVGYGKVRISMVWRSVQLQAPREMLGWQIGTLDVKPTIVALDVPQQLRGLKLKLRTDRGSGKLYPFNEDSVEGWKTRKQRSLHLGVQKRYGSCLTLRFRHKGTFHDSNIAFAVLWLRELADDNEREIELPVWKGNFKRAVSCSLEDADVGERVGTIKLKLNFLSGLGDAHSRWASKDTNMRDVLEVLETTRDNLEKDQAEKKLGIQDGTSDTEDEDDDSDDSSDDEKEDGENNGKKKRSGTDLSRGLVDEAKEYKKNRKGVHRRHKGMMQWRIPRAAQWIGHKVEHAESKVEGLFSRHERGTDIETEI